MLVLRKQNISLQQGLLYIRAVSEFLNLLSLFPEHSCNRKMVLSDPHPTDQTYGHGLFQQRVNYIELRLKILVWFRK